MPLDMPHVDRNTWNLRPERFSDRFRMIKQNEEHIATVVCDVNTTTERC